MKSYKIMAGLIASLFLFTLLAGSSYSQGATDTSGKNVTDLRVKNNKAISKETILLKVKTKVGEPFSQDVLNDDLKRLYATEYFTDVTIDVEDYQGGIAVTFIVEEKPIVEDIIFKGNTAFKAPKLKSTMKSKPNEMLNPAILAQDMAEIRALYVKKGYPMVDVKYEIDVDKDTNKARITVSIDEKVRVKISSVNVTGNKAIKTDVIKKILATKPAWLFNPGIFKDDVLQDDVDRIKSLYDDIGFLDAEVKPKLDYKEQGTVLGITFEINEGRQYLVGDVTIKGNLVFQEKDVRSKIAMKRGKPFSAKILRQDAALIRQYYYQYGYMNVVIDVDKNLDEATGKINIIYNIDAKDPVYVGKIEIRGNVKTKDIVIRRELRVYPGDRFNGDKIRRSKERIYNLGFFENVSFDTEPTETPDVQSLIVTVKETKTGEFSFGGGYSSIDMLIGFVEITQRNFDIMNFPTFTGGGQSLTLKAEIGMVRNNFNIGWVDPWIFGFPYSFGFDAYRTAHTKDSDVGWAYDETRTGGDVRLGKEFTDYLRGALVYRLENIDIENVDGNSSQDLKNEQGKNWLSSLMLEFTQDTRDNIYNPTRGYTIDGGVEDAGGVFMGDKNFVKVTAAAAYYHTFLEKLTLELKGRTGWVTPYGDSNEVPIYERFYAGGANTIRGYKERRVGPRDSGSDEPIGGEAILLGNAELTFPVYEKIIKGAVFFDAGNVWRKTSDYLKSGDYKAGAGIGVRVKTPLGPVRVDWGYPLVSNEENSKTGEFYFSMSRGF